MGKKLSRDAAIFGYAFFANSNSTLSFGGDGAKMEITQRGRNALNELLELNCCKKGPATDSIPNREYYTGCKDSDLIALVEPHGINPFDTHSPDCWTFFKVKGK